MSAKKESVPLTLNGWAPQYFAIARTGSDAGEYVLCSLPSQPRSMLYGRHTGWQNCGKRSRYKRAKGA